MPLVKGIDQPVRDFLADLPWAASAGICMVSDRRGIFDPGSNKRYAYLLLPESATGFILLRVDLETRAIEPLAAPPAAAAGVYQSGLMAALHDPTGGAASNAPTIYVAVAISAAPGIQWMSYTIATNVWAVLTAPVTTAAGASLVTSIAIAHTCGTLGYFFTLNAGIAENLIYVSGNNGLWNNVAGPSNLAVYNKAANNWAYVLGGGAARAGAPAAGSKLIWTPAYPDRLYSNRGGASAVLDFYTFSTDAWAAANPLPAVELNEGSEMVMLYEAPGWIAVRPGGFSNQILAIEAGGFVYQTVCSIDDSRLPAAHPSNALIAWWIAGGYYFGAIPYGRSVIKRIQVPMPL